MHQFALKLAVVALAIGAGTHAQQPTDPTLTFHAWPGDGPGIESASAIQSEPQTLVVRGKLVMPDGCQGLRGHLSPTADHVVKLVIERYRIDREAGLEMLCPRTEVPTRYQARIAPLKGKWRIRVLYWGSGETTTLADTVLYVPPRAN
jgi:hypothetical protein